MRGVSQFIIVLGAFFALAAAGCSPARSVLPQAAEGEGQPPMRAVTVNGTGRVTLTPDLARIFIGVQTEGEEARQAVSSNNARTQQVIESLRGFGIAEEDIRTTDFSIYPRQDYDREGRPIQTRYMVQNTVLVTVRDLERIGEVLDASVEAGANNITGIQFDVADRAGANAESLQAAIQDARAKAESLARAAGIRLGPVHAISSVIQGGITPEFFRGDIVAAEEAGVPISPGQMEITVDVTVVYQIQ